MRFVILKITQILHKSIKKGLRLKIQNPYNWLREVDFTKRTGEFHEPCELVSRDKVESEPW